MRDKGLYWGGDVTRRKKWKTENERIERANGRKCEKTANTGFRIPRTSEHMSHK